MEIRHLQNQLRTLIELEETSSPVISYFLDCDDPDAARLLHEQIVAARKALDPLQRAAFDRALRGIEDHVPWKLDEATRSVASFARAGEDPLFVVLEFEASLSTRLVVDASPAIFPLVEMKDTFDRYVLMICTEESARVLEVSLGSVTREAWARRPELRTRVGREWTKLHYQNHRRDRAERFVKEKIALVGQLMNAGGHSHLMLAGSPKVVARVRKSLPKRLADSLVDTIPASARDRATDVVLATMSTFVEHEEKESQSAVALLRHELRRGGLAVCGVEACRDALESGQADQLIVLGEGDTPAAEARESLARLAVQNDVHVEVVQHSDALAELGGVGCLLRYRSWDRALDATTGRAA